jgi:hypothetical protein
MSRAMSKSFVLRRQSPGAKETNKVHQDCLAIQETEAVEIDPGMSTALSKSLFVNRQGPSQGVKRERQGSARLPCRENGAY